MSFLPRRYHLGDHVRITQDLSNANGTFAAGHEFEIIDQHVRHGIFVFDLRDRDLNILAEVESGYLSYVPKVD